MKSLNNLLCIVLCFFCLKAYSQVSVDITTTANEMADFLTGEGVTISSPQIDGGGGFQKGLFSGGGDIIGIEEGILLTTGVATWAANSNNMHIGGETPLPQEFESTLITSDPDLNQLQSNLTGVSIFEFDVVINKSALEFEFVFASEEYPLFVGSEFNDVFGFFISGPGIDGEFSNGAKNIALVPGSDQFVSINNVSHLTNSEYFNVGGGVNNNGANITYNGFTDVIQVSCPVICGETYHLKMAISNVNDDNHDSAVFIKAGSLFSDFTIGELWTDVQPICEGEAFDITIEDGLNGWTYEWSDGQITNTPTTSMIAMDNQDIYSVIVTDENGCSLTAEVEVEVHTNDNVPPYTTGIDGTGEFLAYVQAGDQLCFDIPSFDNPEEEVLFIEAGSFPDGAILNSNNAPQETGTFCWTPSEDDIGFHTFSVIIEDDNVCYSEQTEVEFEIKVGCSYCPINVYYENRQPAPDGIPLPPLTIASKFIIAGEDVDDNQVNGPVIVGEEEVTFWATDVITIEPGFDSGDNFTAIIDPTSCTTNCQDCCDDWDGFNIEIPNVFSPDGNGINDFWEPFDFTDPFCAFGADQFWLTIFNSWGTPIYSQQFTNGSGGCCPFESSAPENDILHGSIFWDGTHGNSGNDVSEGVYWYTLTIAGCGGEESFTGSVAVFRDKSMITDSSNGDKEQLPLKETGQIPSDHFDLIENTLDSFREPIIFPNPANELVYIDNLEENSQVQLISADGRVIKEFKVTAQGRISIDLNFLESASYVIRIFSLSSQSVFEQVIIKQ